MKPWPQKVGDGSFKRLFADRIIYYYWYDVFNKAYSGEIDTWDYQWAYSCLVARGLSIVPCVNLISNVGFRDDATHTNNKNSNNSTLRVTELGFPLIHQNEVEADERNDQFIYREIYKVFKKYSFRKRVERSFKSIKYRIGVILKSATDK